MGGAGRSTYFLTVFLEMPSCLAIPLRGTPCSLAWRTAFHRACFHGVASLGGGVQGVGLFSSSIGWSAGVPKAGKWWSCFLVRPCWLRFLTTWASPGVGASAPWAARRAPALGGASWWGIIPSVLDHELPSLPSSTSTLTPA